VAPGAQHALGRAQLGAAGGGGALREVRVALREVVLDNTFLFWNGLEVGLFLFEDPRSSLAFLFFVEKMK